MGKGKDRKTAGFPVTNVFATVGSTFVTGDWKTRVSYLILGFGQLLRGQIVKGIAYLLMEAGFIWYLVTFGHKYVAKITTLGTVETQKISRKTVYGDNSFLILLFGILTIIIIPITGCIFGVLADFVMNHIGIDLKHRRAAE